MFSDTAAGSVEFMDDIRRRIAERLKELGKSQSWLSHQLGRNRGYIYEYLEGSPADLPYEVKIRVAELLEMSTRELGVAEIGPATAHTRGGMAEDGAPYQPPSGHFLSKSQHIAYFRMQSHALDQHPERIRPGDLLAFDLNKVKTAEIESGAIVLVQLYDKHDLARSFGTVIRQFVAPNKLITNSSEANEMISLDDTSLPYEPVIKGTLLSVVREVQ